MTGENFKHSTKKQKQQEKTGKKNKRECNRSANISKKTGRNYETRVVKFFRSKGYQSKRVPLSGSLPWPNFKNDVHVDDFKPLPLEIECKKTTSSDEIRLFFSNIDKIGLQENRGSFLLLVFSLQRTKNFVILPFNSSFPFFTTLSSLVLPVKDISHKEKSLRLKREDLELVKWNPATGRFNCLKFQSYTGQRFIITDLDWLVSFIEEEYQQQGKKNGRP
ncbi:MAG: putative PDDEXK endonuclease [Candidatus Hodarchaeales archaeon]